MCKGFIFKRLHLKRFIVLNDPVEKISIWLTSLWIIGKLFTRRNLLLFETEPVVNKTEFLEMIQTDRIDTVVRCS